MTDYDAFVAVICERTAQGLDTTTNRLIFADWLEENAGSGWCSVCDNQGVIGDPTEPTLSRPCPCCHGSASNGYAERAEFIGTQIQLAALDAMEGESLVGSQITLRRREQELWQFNRETWCVAARTALGSLATRLPDTDEAMGVGRFELYFSDQVRIGCAFRRGFVAWVRCSFGEWCGKVCGNCNGTGKSLITGLRCGRCNGTGRVKGLGPAIVAAAPIEEFEATDSIMSPEIASVIWGPHSVGSSNRKHNNRRALQWAREKAFLEVASANPSKRS